MILLILKNKGGCIEIIDKQKYEQNRKNKYLKMQVTIIKQITERSLIKERPWHKERVSYYTNRLLQNINTYCPLYIYLSNCTGYYKYL